MEIASAANIHVVAAGAGKAHLTTQVSSEYLSQRELLTRLHDCEG